MARPRRDWVFAVVDVVVSAPVVGSRRMRMWRFSMAAMATCMVEQTSFGIQVAFGWWIAETGSSGTAVSEVRWNVAVEWSVSEVWTLWWSHVAGCSCPRTSDVSALRCCRSTRVSPSMMNSIFGFCIVCLVIMLHAFE